MRTVTLLKPHTHAGHAYAAGDTLDVSTLDALWLEAVGVARAGARGRPTVTTPAAAPPATDIPDSAELPSADATDNPTGV